MAVRASTIFITLMVFQSFSLPCAEYATSCREDEGKGPSLLQTKSSKAKVLDSVDHRTAKSQTLHSQSRALDRRIQSYAAGLEQGVGYEFLRNLRLCAPCDKFERLGEEDDGGYVMCTDGLDHGLVGAYSYGINGYDGWGMAVASRYNISLNEYDCYNLDKPAPCHKCSVNFHAECILNHDAQPKKDYKTLSDHFMNAGDASAADASLLLKLDVEGAEWEMFLEEPLANLKKFRQIVVEFHEVVEHIHKQSCLLAAQRMKQAGFAVAHLHGNNYMGAAGLGQYGNYYIPNILEVTYVQHPSGDCAATLPPYHLEGLDHPNIDAYPELPDAVLPA